MRLAHVLLLAACSTCAACALHMDTHALLSQLGLERVRAPAPRKRLAEHARRRAAPDSRMFLVKLPPSSSYYAHAGAAGGADAARQLPLPLTSNGKPARVYHWNLPALHRLAAARREDAPQAARRAHPNAIDAHAYYVPADNKSFRKYFSGNGKPKSFYLIDKDRKPSHYHRLLP